jgi:hypothetical protein
MPEGNDSDRYVVPNEDRGGWDVVKEDHKRASAHTNTQKTSDQARRRNRRQPRWWRCPDSG